MKLSPYYKISEGEAFAWEEKLYVVKKTKKRVKLAVAAILRLMLNVEGPGCVKRVMLCGVMKSVVLNRAPV